SGSFFLAIAVLSVLQGSSFNTVLWGVVAGVQWISAVRSPGFTFFKARAYIITTIRNIRIPYWRFLSGSSGGLFGIITFLTAWDGQFTTTIMVTWIGALMCWWVVLNEPKAASDEAVPPKRLPIFRLTRERVALAVLLLMGGTALFYNLYNLPRD